MKLNDKEYKNAKEKFDSDGYVIFDNIPTLNYEYHWWYWVAHCVTREWKFVDIKDNLKEKKITKEGFYLHKCYTVN